MKRHHYKKINYLLLLLLIGCASNEHTKPEVSAVSTVQTIEANCPSDAGWNDPAVPRQIFANTWYVGTCGISAVLITSKKGHVLIDGATEKGADLIEANIKALGFRLQDVDYILNSHEHFDHAAGIAQLQRKSNAVVIANETAANTLERGFNDRSDPQFKTLEKFPAASAVQRIAENETIELNSIRMSAHATPGHTPGSTSWTWTSCEGNKCLNIAYVDSLTAISDDEYLFSDESSNPGVLKAFYKTLDTVSSLPCDILITPHPSASDLWSRMGEKPSQALLDKNACRAYSNKAFANLAKRVEQERGK
jgi:metallo-beta-lactamase class B